MSSRARVGRWEAYLWPVLATSVCVAVWHVLVRWSQSAVFPAPVDVERALAELLRRGLLWSYVWDSLRRVATGFLLAAVCGIPAGLTLGWYPAAGGVVNPVVQMLRPISPIAWIPIAILWFGVGDRAAEFLVFLAAVFPIVVASMNGVRRVPPMFLRAGRNFGLGPWRLLVTVVLPAALPQIVIGLRLALGIAWLVIVAAEMIAVDSGLGYLVIDARNAGKRYDLVVAAMVVIGAIGLALDVGVRAFERSRTARWGMRDEG